MFWFLEKQPKEDYIVVSLAIFKCYNIFQDQTIIGSYFCIHKILKPMLYIYLSICLSFEKENGVYYYFNDIQNFVSVCTIYIFKSFQL